MVFQMNRFLRAATLTIALISFASYAKDNSTSVTSSLEAKNAIAYQQHIVAGQPSWNDLLKLKQSGIKKIINLRGEGEFNEFDQEQAVKALGMEYFHIPVSGANGVTFENADKLHQLLSDNPHPAFIHCASGNRVGALTALNAFKHNKMTPEQAIAECKKAGMTRLSKKVATMLEN